MGRWIKWSRAQKHTCTYTYLNKRFYTEIFNYARSRLHPSYRIGPIKRPDSTTTMDETERADFFNKFFHSVFVPDDGNSPPSVLTPTKLCPLPYFRYLTSGNPSLLPLVLYHVALMVFPLALHLKKFPELCSFLCDLFNMSLQQSCVPKAWKTANIVAIYKSKESTLEVNNYRPNNLTNIFVRLLKGLFVIILYLN